MVFKIVILNQEINSSRKVKEICDTYKLELKKAAYLKEDFEIQGIIRFEYEESKPTKNLLPEKQQVYFDEVTTLTDDLLKRMKMVNKQNEKLHSS